MKKSTQTRIKLFGGKASQNAKKILALLLGVVMLVGLAPVLIAADADPFYIGSWAGKSTGGADGGLVFKTDVKKAIGDLVVKDDDVRIFVADVWVEFHDDGPGSGVESENVYFVADGHQGRASFSLIGHEGLGKWNTNYPNYSTKADAFLAAVNFAHGRFEWYFGDEGVLFGIDRGGGLVPSTDLKGYFLSSSKAFVNGPDWSESYAINAVHDKKEDEGKPAKPTIVSTKDNVGALLADLVPSDTTDGVSLQALTFALDPVFTFAKDFGTAANTKKGLPVLLTAAVVTDPLFDAAKEAPGAVAKDRLVVIFGTDGTKLPLTKTALENWSKDENNNYEPFTALGQDNFLQAIADALNEATKGTWKWSCTKDTTNDKKLLKLVAETEALAGYPGYPTGLPTDTLLTVGGGVSSAGTKTVVMIGGDLKTALGTLTPEVDGVAPHVTFSILDHEILFYTTDTDNTGTGPWLFQSTGGGAPRGGYYAVGAWDGPLGDAAFGQLLLLLNDLDDDWGWTETDTGGLLAEASVYGFPGKTGPALPDNLSISATAVFGSGVDWTEEGPLVADVWGSEGAPAIVGTHRCDVSVEDPGSESKFYFGWQFKGDGFVYGDVDWEDSYESELDWDRILPNIANTLDNIDPRTADQFDETVERPKSGLYFKIGEIEIGVFRDLNGKIIFGAQNAKTFKTFGKMGTGGNTGASGHATYDNHWKDEKGDVNPPTTTEDPSWFKENSDAFEAALNYVSRDDKLDMGWDWAFGTVNCEDGDYWPWGGDNWTDDTTILTATARYAGPYGTTYNATVACTPKNPDGLTLTASRLFDINPSGKGPTWNDEPIDWLKGSEKGIAATSGGAGLPKYGYEAQAILDFSGIKKASELYDDMFYIGDPRLGEESVEFKFSSAIGEPTTITLSPDEGPKAIAEAVRDAINKVRPDIKVLDGFNAHYSNGIDNPETQKPVNDKKTNEGHYVVIKYAHSGEKGKLSIGHGPSPEAPPPVLSTDATLKSLSWMFVTTVNDAPVFGDPTAITLVNGKTEYDVELPVGTSKTATVAITGVPTDAKASFLNDMDLIGVTLKDGKGTVILVVVAEDGVTEKPYTVNFTVKEEEKKEDTKPAPTGGGGGPAKASAPAAPAIAPSKNVTEFVTALYKIALGRAPDPGGLANWTGLITSGKMSPAVAVKHFLLAEEVVLKNLSHAQFVELLYNIFMGRKSDEGGLDNWVGLLVAGMSRESVINHFFASPEFTAIQAAWK